MTMTWLSMGPSRRPAAAGWLFAMLFLAVCCFPAAAAPGERAAKALPSVLYFTYSSGYKHEVVPESEQILVKLGEDSGRFRVTVSHDPAIIDAAQLARYDAVVFYTTGELPIDARQKRDLLAFVEGGKGFVGVHSASDTFYQWPQYGRMLGGYFDEHPWNQEVTVKVEDRKHPATRGLGASFVIADEIYQFKDWSRADVHVLLSLDTGSVDLKHPKVHRQDGDFALAWTRTQGKGRVFYTALGHRPEVWRDPRFQGLLIGGLEWVLGK
ncbi:ThuA domain-containing protein [Lysobacter sp. TAB13]|uniref:ThuA domain-containing protein n=1 Tax=Lysobacter sp. TAB13 TaxID=3233065 RepID=UPI003F9B0AB4